VGGPRYLDDVVTLNYDETKCTGCQMCTIVCPHAVFVMEGHRARLADRDACMECGACERNCAFGAIGVDAGVGCAAGVIAGWIRGTEPGCGGGEPACDSTGGGCC
jgi:NAD-dependent dihydropyrimidine dehydrogenase PreA subunit